MTSNSLTTFALLALMAVAFYFLIMRPQRKRQQEMQHTLASLAPGTRVMTGSGLFGTIVAIGERQAVLEISPGVELTVLKQAIARVATDAEEDVFHDGPADDGLSELDSEIVEPDLGGPIDPARGSAFDDGPGPQTGSGPERSSTKE